MKNFKEMTDKEIEDYCKNEISETEAQEISWVVHRRESDDGIDEESDMGKILKSHFISGWNYRMLYQYKRSTERLDKILAAKENE